jgi:hypothetical protein
MFSIYFFFVTLFFAAAVVILDFLVFAAGFLEDFLGEGFELFFFRI